jgi:hypothetical protein
VDDTLVEVLHASFIREHGMIVVIVGVLARRRGGQLHDLVEGIGQVECARRRARLAGTALRGLRGTGKSIVGSGRATEGIVA